MPSAVMLGFRAKSVKIMGCVRAIHCCDALGKAMPADRTVGKCGAGNLKKLTTPDNERGFAKLEFCDVRRRFAGTAIAFAGIAFPRYTQRVEYEGISYRQFAGLDNDLVGVINDWIAGDAPGFVTDNTFAMLACGLRAVAVAVKPGDRDTIGHRQPSGLEFNGSPSWANPQQPLSEVILRLPGISSRGWHHKGL